MKIESWLSDAVATLQQNGVQTARLDALVLLEDVLNIDRAVILAHPETDLSIKNINVLNTQVTKRSQHTPLAYIREKTEFYGRSFIITPAVLEPRPESEAMIDLLKELVNSAAEFTDRHHTNSTSMSKLVKNNNTTSQYMARDEHLHFASQTAKVIRIADVGSGSGALGITAKLELKNAQVELLEIDPSALAVTKMNVVMHTADILSIKSDLLENTSKNYDILLCNLPYVPDGLIINKAAEHEPKVAIFGGADGLDIYRKLFARLKIVEKFPLYILIEALPAQHDKLQHIALKSGYELLKTEDFIQLYKHHT